MGAIGILHSLSTAATFQVQADNSTGFASTELLQSSTAEVAIWNSTGYVASDSTTLVKAGTKLVLLNSTSDSDPKRRYILFNFTDTGMGTVQINRLVVSEPIEFTNGFKYGHNYTMTDLSEVRMTAFGRLHAEDRPTMDGIELSLNQLSQDDAMQKFKQKLMRPLKTHGEMVVSLRPDVTSFEEEETIYCRFKQMPRIVNIPTPKIRYTAKCVLEELL
jgi:hypothetical protein